MPFRATFDCLWCGTAWTTRGHDDLEGWAQLCPDCLGKAGANPFLRNRLRTAIAERGAAGSSRAATHTATPAATALAAPPPAAPDTDSMVAYYEARAAEYDDWYQRRGRYERGPIHDTAWHAELDAAGRWLDALPIHGRIVELAAGTGWWSPLLAGKGELTLYDAAPATLDRARERLVAHRLRAHLHVRDAWAEPEGDPADALFTGFWVSHVERERLPAFLGLVASWLKPGGRYALIDSLPDPASGAADHPAPSDDRSVRRLDDGRAFEIVKVYYRPDELAAALEATGFHDVEVTTTGRFFVLATGVR
jgi:demethylmenaquinone methyltransferase/2-methoxy-6-polyprenyl-1,4-benzoquinol methylase